MKYLIFFLIITLLGASEVEITADKFTADETKGISIFTGSVHVTRGKDDLKANKVVVNFDKKKQPTLYTASGNAKAKLTMKGKNYFAKGDTLIYNPLTLKYIIKKNAFLQEISSDKKIYGENISVDQARGYYEVDGKKNKPVKFIFKIQDKKK